MIQLNTSEITSVIASLRSCYDKQVDILANTDQIIMRSLPAAWSSTAEEAYNDAYRRLREGTLTNINDLINCFQLALGSTNESMQTAIVDLSTLNQQR